MGKRYYCDYCDTSFPDGKESRKKHNTGQIHLKMKETHYRNFGDARTRLNLELEKGPCSRILQGLQCRFGEYCHFSHMQHHEIDHLRYTAIIEEMGKVRIPEQLKHGGNSIQSFIDQAEKLTKIRQAEECVAKLLQSPVDFIDSDKIPLPNS